MVYFGKVKIYVKVLGVRVTNFINDWVFSKNRVYEPVNVLECAIWADFVPQRIMKACRAGHLNFSLSFPHILSALFDIQMKRSRKMHEFTI